VNQAQTILLAAATTAREEEEEEQCTNEQKSDRSQTPAKFVRVNRVRLLDAIYLCLDG